jgi:hypothetical protein
LAGYQQRSVTEKIDYNFIWRVPVVAILAITPLIVYLAVRPVPEVFRSFWIQDKNFDFFSFYKARWFFFWSVPLLISFAFCLYKRKDQYLDFVRKTKYYWMLSIVFIVSILLSAIVSPAPFIAWGGMFDRYEGGWAWLGYCLLFAACAFLMRQEIDFRYITGAIVFSTTVIALIGVFQFFDMDIFRSSFGQFLIVPEKYVTMKLGFIFEKGKIYSTFFNTNYGGNIAGIALPLAVCMCLFVPNFKKSGGLLLGYSLLIFILAVGCRSQSGVVGLFMAFTFLIIYLARHYRDKFKRLVLIMALFLPIYIVMDRYTGGALSGQFTERFLKDRGAIKAGKALLVFVYDACRTQTGVVGLLIVLVLLIVWFVRRYRIRFKQLILVIALMIPIFIGMDIYADGPVREESPDVVMEERIVDSSVLDSLDDDYVRFLLSRVKNKTFFDEKIIEFGRYGSGRGYIYLRAIEQRLNSHLFLGTGPDTFSGFFPQNDAFRLFGGFPRSMMIDKMHSMFLQIWFNTGLISFIAFILLIMLHFINSVRIFWKVRVRSTVEVLGLGFFLGWVGFLGASLFNDSAICVAPYFWAGFGASVAANYVIRYATPIAIAVSDDRQKPKIKRQARFDKLL